MIYITRTTNPDQIKRITIDIEDNLYGYIKTLAFVDDKSITALARDALKAYCKDHYTEDIQILDPRKS